MKSTRSAFVSPGPVLTQILCFAVALFCASSAFAATPYSMSSGNYSQGFDDIANWTDGFASGIGAANFGPVLANATGTIPDGVKITTATDTFKTGATGGVQKGTGNIVLLSTGTTDNSTSDAIDLYLDFTSVTAGTLSFDWAEVNNGTGNRQSSIRVYTTTDGTTFTELTSAAVLNVANNVASSGTISGVQLPAALNNTSTARIRFYYYNGTGGTTGSRPKISLDNIQVTGTGGASTGFISVETKADGTGVVVPAQSITSSNSVTVYAIQRNASSNFVGNVAATWSLAGANGGVVAGDLVPAGDSKSATFTGHAAGTTKVRVASAGLSSVDSGLLTVVGGAATQIRVETAADGSGTVVPAQTVVAAHSVKMYAITRDAYGNFVANVAASAWTLPAITGNVVSTDLIVASDSKSATFIGNQPGTTTVRASSGALTTVDSGVLTVVQATVAPVVISQVYGGGGNSSATYQSDYVELFNRTANPVSISGWSVQYASSAGTSYSGFAPLTNNTTIPAYSYYLVKLAAGTNAAADFSADITNTTVNLGAGGGKVALVNVATNLVAVTLPDSRVIDFVGYGANTFEGNGAAPAPGDNATAVFRNNGGCTDTDNNAADFALAAPGPRTTANSSSACPANPPTISSIGNQAIDSAATVGPITFTVNDVETPATSLTVSASVSSSNPSLLPNNQITFGGSGIVRNITLHPASGQTGNAQITVTVTDSDNMTAQTVFNLFVGTGPQYGVVFADNFDEYPNGGSDPSLQPYSLSFIGQTQGGYWQPHNGTPYEIYASNGVCYVSSPLTNSEDISATLTNAPFTTSSGTILYVGAKITVASLPTATGEYFMHLKDNTTSNFFCRIFANTENAASGTYRLGISNAKTTNGPSVQFPVDLTLNTAYSVVARYKVGVGIATLWVNPTSINDTSVTATDSITPGEIDMIALREPGTTNTLSPSGSQLIDNLIISTSFNDVVTLVPLPPTITATHTATSITLTWPTNNNSGYILQTASTVNATTWTAVGGVTTSGANYTVTIPFTSTPAFYRLKQ